MPLEVEMQLKYTSVETAFESMSLRHLPLFVYNSECDIFIRYTSAEANRKSICSTIRLKIKLWGFGLVSKIGIEYVELVALNHFWRRVL